VAGRDYSRVVVAEDDAARAAEMREILEVIGGYEVWVTKNMDGIRSLLDESNAGWLIQDLNLEDGNSAGIVPLMRARYGTDLFIFILTGYFEDYPEYGLLVSGADFYLRKPYEPKALLQQMETLRARMEGHELRQDPGVMLRCGGGVLDLERGMFIKGKDVVTIPTVQVKLLKLLADARDKDGWKYVDRAEILMHVWGEDFDKDPKTATERVRKVRTRLRSTLGFEITEVRKAGSRHNPIYRLTNDVKLMG